MSLFQQDIDSTYSKASASTVSADASPQAECDDAVQAADLIFTKDAFYTFT